MTERALKLYVFVCTADLNEVPGMNIINKFAESLGMPVVNFNIY